MPILDRPPYDFIDKVYRYNIDRNTQDPSFDDGYIDHGGVAHVLVTSNECPFRCNNQKPFKTKKYLKEHLNRSHEEALIYFPKRKRLSPMEKESRREDATKKYREANRKHLAKEEEKRRFVKSCNDLLHEESTNLPSFKSMVLRNMRKLILDFPGCSDVNLIVCQLPAEIREQLRRTEVDQEVIPCTSKSRLRRMKCEVSALIVRTSRVTPEECASRFIQ